MTIKRGQSWGERRPVPANLAVATSDARAATLIAAGCREFLLTGGDMWRTIGGSSESDTNAHADRTVVTLDSLLVSFRRDGAVFHQPVLAHAIVSGEPSHSDSRFFSRLPRCCRPKTTTYVMNAQYLGTWDVIPRGHPNDGRFDVLTVPASMPWRQRWEFRRRLPTGTHIPHPLVEVRTIADSWGSIASGYATLDGAQVGHVEDVSVTIEPDSLTVWI